MTKLPNRVLLADRLQHAIEYSKRHTDYNFSFFFIDIDHFKRINDSYGHPIGDRFLRMIAWTLANAVRRLDTAARWGGEEFIVIAPNASVGILTEIAERIRVLVGRSWITYDSTQKITATVSIGGAVARKGETIETLVERADSRLYACKRSGRNRVEVGD